MTIVLFLLGLFLALLAVSANRRPRGHRPMWVTAMIGSELAGVLLVGATGVLLGFRALGWAGGPTGVAGQILLVVALAGFMLALLRGWRGREALERAAGSMIGEEIRLDSPGPLAVLGPLPRRPRDVVLEEGLRYGPHERHLLDRVGSEADRPSPVLIHVHGGGWWRGRRDTQARPMIHRMARAGWEVFTPAYRLSPEATFPDHLVDVKRCVAWIRSQADRFGIDPGFIAISGGSTGGNLAALAALTNGDADLQPGFEDQDATVQACVPFYGVHDMLNPAGGPLWPYLASTVMKSDPELDLESWRRASPVQMVRPDRPPFFVVHGANDTLVPATLSQRLVESLVDAGGPAVGYAEVPWANHGFDFFAGPRGRMNAAAVLAVLGHLYAEHRARAEDSA